MTVNKSVNYTKNVVVKKIYLHQRFMVTNIISVLRSQLRINPRDIYILKERKKCKRKRGAKPFASQAMESKQEM